MLKKTRIYDLAMQSFAFETLRHFTCPRSEVQLQPQLNIARKMVAVKLAVSSIVDVIVHAVKGDVIEGVEHFKVELRAESFGHLDVFHQRDISVVIARPGENAIARRAEMTHGLRKCRRVEPFGHRARPL